MTKHRSYICILSLLFIIFIIPFSIYAQDDTTAIVTDSTDMYDSADAADTSNTLYFLGKEYASLNDSSAIVHRMVPDSAAQHLKSDNDFWYANKDLNSKKKKETEHLSAWERFWLAFFEMLVNPVFRQVMWIIILAAFGAAVVWFLVQNKMNIFGSGKGAVIAANVSEGQVENIFATDLQAAINQAVKSGNYRLAIRFSYLKLLRTFSEGGLIQYKNDSTNMQYLTQLYSTPFYKDFFNLTRTYEYAWYGEITVTSAQYESIQNDFDMLYQKTSFTS